MDEYIQKLIDKGVEAADDYLTGVSDDDSRAYQRGTLTLKVLLQTLFAVERIDIWNSIMERSYQKAAQYDMERGRLESLFNNLMADEERR